MVTGYERVIHFRFLIGFIFFWNCSTRAEFNTTNISSQINQTREEEYPPFHLFSAPKWWKLARNFKEVFPIEIGEYGYLWPLPEYSTGKSRVTRDNPYMIKRVRHAPRYSGRWGRYLVLGHLSLFKCRARSQFTTWCVGLRKKSIIIYQKIIYR